MIKMISVIIDGTTEYTITFSNLNYQLRVNQEVVFENLDFTRVREELLKETGV